MAVGPVRSVGPIRFGNDYELDTQMFVLRRSGRALKLERIPMAILLLLLGRAGELVTREEIAESVWGKDVYLDTDNSINSAIRKIRLVLRDDPENPRFVQTVVGRGYLFLASQLEGDENAHAEPQASDRLSDSLTGRRIGDYRILHLLGGGGMGVVYKAEDLKLGRQVAIKFLPRELAGDPAAFAQMQREAQMASALDHPHICSIYQFTEHEGQPFIVMPLLEGQTLREWIAKEASRPATTCVREVVNLAVQISEALQYAHEKGIVHRDIKPANIFLTARGEIKILDFGVATIRGATSTIGTLQEQGTAQSREATRTGLSPGTPAYQSPEQVRGQKLDARSDIFSVGSVLYEMTTAKRPFRGDSVAEMQHAILETEPQPIRELKTGVPAEFEAIVARMLQKDPDRRYQSAQNLRDDLEQLSDRIYTGSKWKRETLLAVTAALLVVATMGAWAIHKWRRSATPKVASSVVARRSVAVLGFRNLSGKPDQDWISTALAEILSTELASGHQLRVVPGESVSRLKRDLSLSAPESYSAPTLARIHRNVGADLVVLGSYLQSDTVSSAKIRVDVRVQDASSGDTIAAFSETGNEQEIADLASNAGATVREKLGLQTDSQNKNPKDSLPANEEAVRLYSQGLEKLRNFDASGARDTLWKAIAADPNFAPSHSALAESLSVLGYDQQARSEAKKAFDLSRNASRENQLLIEARYRELTRDLPAAVDAYRTLWKFFPDDIGYGLRLASAQIKAGSPRDALTTISQLRELPEPLADDPRIDLTEAKAFESISDFPRGVRAASDAELKATHLGNQLVLAHAIQQKAYLASDLEQQGSALAEYQQARSIWIRAGNHRAAAIDLHSIAMLQYRAGDFEASQQTFQQALTVFKQLGSMWDIASCSNNYAILLTDWGKLPEAKAALEQALQIQRDLKDKRGVASDLDDLSNVLMMTGDLNTALRDKEQALQLFRDVQNPAGEAVTLTNLGELFVRRGDLAHARESYEQSLALKQKLGFKRGIGFALSGLVEVSIRQDRLVEARQFASQAIDLRKQLGDTYNTAISDLQLAEVALEQGNATEAEGLVRTSATLFDKQRATRDSAAASTLLARILLQEGKIKDAQQTAARAQSLAKPSGDIQTELQAMLADAVVKSATGNSGEALSLVRNVASRARRQGFRGAELESRLLMGSLEVTSGHLQSGRAHLAQVEKDATAAGFTLIARKARALELGRRAA
jgi:eukaryotic-like serine/threonine-protein kinase